MKFREAVEKAEYQNGFLYGDPDAGDLNDIICTCIEQHGGEGQGDNIWAVYKVTEEGQEKYYKVNGWYASYDGASYQDTVEVEPYQETVTKFKEV